MSLSVLRLAMIDGITATGGVAVNVRRSVWSPMGVGGVAVGKA